MAQLRTQAIGSLTCVVVVFGVAMIGMKLIMRIRGSWRLRVSKDGELEGLDIHEHGTPAYHVEFGYGMTYSTPANIGGSGPPPREMVKVEPADTSKVDDAEEELPV